MLCSIERHVTQFRGGAELASLLLDLSTENNLERIFLSDGECFLRASKNCSL